MTPLSRLVAGSAAALLLASSTTCLAGSSGPHDRRAVVLICRDTGDAALCAALASALSNRDARYQVSVSGPKPATDATPALQVEFIAEVTRRDSLSGHLIWQTQDAQLGIGPSLEISIMDAALNDDALLRFATQLVAHSNLPL